jgi:hypothetical protein
LNLECARAQHKPTILLTALSSEHFPKAHQDSVRDSGELLVIDEQSILDTPTTSQANPSVGLYLRCILSEKVAVSSSPGQKRENSHFSWSVSASPPQASGWAPPRTGVSSRLGLIQAGWCLCNRDTRSREDTRETAHVFTRRPRQVRGSAPGSRSGSPHILMLVAAEVATLQQARVLLPGRGKSNLSPKGQVKEKVSHERRCPREKS